jgi:peptidoglycan hydrolase CwlO-like protein
MALVSTYLQELVSQLQGQLQSVNDQLAQEQTKVTGLQAQKQQLQNRITDLKAYIVGQGG